MSKLQSMVPAILFSLLGSCLALAQAPPQGAPQAPPPPMSFFVTSVGLGKGADLGGLAGADAQCQKLAAAVGAGNRTWRAYLSTQGQGAVNARDRIGQGPWHNAKGVIIAPNVADLHGDVQRDRNNIKKSTALNEKGEEVNGVGNQPNQHDILTGSQSDGKAFTDNADHTCKNWTSSSDGTALLGHHDRNGGSNTSWNSAHTSRGCSQENLVASGGAGLLYCFAAQ
ncbi:MAG: lectin [Acidobacteria bacterium RIFCSPLOWO2_12_FULL_60_22]|nr:MAG: lectin [Acidobacteria bacterium RIFCSPLOWO2_12_FULL_60_22]